MDSEASPVTILRIADVFGVGQKHGRFFSELIDAALHKRSFTLFGSGAKTRSYIGVEDLTRFFLSLLTNEESGPLHKIINVCYDGGISNLTIAKIWSGVFNLEVLQDHRIHEDATTRIMIPGPGLTLVQENVEDAIRRHFVSIKESIL
jgi:nucleoside-diphosphate-sugar epimerase